MDNDKIFLVFTFAYFLIIGYYLLIISPFLVILINYGIVSWLSITLLVIYIVLLFQLFDSGIFIVGYFKREKNWRNIPDPKGSFLADVFAWWDRRKKPKFFKIILYYTHYVLEMFLAFGTFPSAYFTHKGRKLSRLYPENRTCQTHDAFVLAPSTPWSKSVYGNGIDLLISFFHDNGFSYKCYLCFSKQEFEKLLFDQTVSSIWIFGHGARGLAKFTDGSFKYSDIAEKNISKDYIYQFHCNHGFEKSLAEIVSNGRGYANNKLNSFEKNHWDIYEILKSFDCDNNCLRS